MKRSATLLVVLMLLLSTSAFAQYNMYDYDFLGGGARSQGMGKAFYAVSDDITAGTWNPAGLISSDKPVLGLSWSNLSPTGNSVVTVYDAQSLDHSGSFGQLSSLNFIAPIRIKGHPFALSANYNRNFSSFEQMAISIADDRIFSYYRNDLGLIEDTNNYVVDQNLRMEGGVHALNLGFGTRVYNNLSFGGSINVYTGHTLFKSFTNTDIYDLRYSDLVQIGQFNQTVAVTDTNKFQGVNFTLGFKYDQEKLDLALVIKTPFELKANRERSIYTITSFNGLIEDNGTDTTYFNDLQLKYEMPLMLGLGFAYQAKENLLVAGDIEYRSFSGRKIYDRVGVKINPSGDNEEEFIEIDPNWKSVFTFRLGAEYLKEQSFGTIPLRAGFGYVPLPDQDVDLSGNTSQPVQYNLSLGTGIQWEQIHFDIGYTYEIKDRNFSQIVQDELNTFALSAVEEDRNHHITISFTGVF